MKSLETLYAKSAQTIDILSPAVGRAGSLPDSGHIVTGGSSVGTLEILGTLWLLQLPSPLKGQVATGDEYRVKSVCYGERLFSLLPIEGHQQFAEENGEKKAASPSRSYCEISAITQGIFYRRPSPDAAAYVEVGSEVKTGQVLGLIEVMKCFNQVVYAGDLPPMARVVEICAEDGAEVQYRQPLFRFEPLPSH